MPATVVGKELKTKLGLDKFKYALVTKVLDTTQPIFAVHVDSMFPTTNIPYNRIKQLKSFTMNKLKKQSNLVYNFKNLRQTPPVPLDQFSGDIPNNAIVIVNDLAGEWRLDSKMYESLNFKVI
jgi:hypothetical protein